jgi:hypothetical protein
MTPMLRQLGLILFFITVTSCSDSGGRTPQMRRWAELGA